MNLRNRLIWIATLTVAFAVVQLVATRRKANQELVEYLKDELIPFANECAAQSRPGSQSARGTLTLEVSVVPEGKLAASVERVEVAASSEVQGPELAACIREHAKALTLKHPLPDGPKQLVLTLPVAPPTSEGRP